MEWQAIAAKITEVSGVPFQIERTQMLEGGCINQAWKIEGRDRSFFVKVNHARLTAMFAAEAEGLGALRDTHTVKVPEPVASGIAGGHAYLVLEFLDLRARDSRADRRLGEMLAALHSIEQPVFGGPQDNFIGSTPQFNPQTTDWLTFWRDFRLAYQLRLAAKQGRLGHLQQMGERLLTDMAALFAGYIPKPSLLHGDLWSGNAAMAPDGEPVIYDPACYWGDREADLAMTELFGGFGASFYDAYQKIMPLDPGYRLRKQLYNLYHILNHLNLFGGGYLRQAETLLERLLSELR